MSDGAAAFSPLQRLRVLAAALPGLCVYERTMEQPFDRVWAYVSDLERSVPAFEPTVEAFRFTTDPGRRRTAVVRTRIGPVTVPRRFVVELREGWCLMRSGRFVVVMAAAPLGEGTGYAQAEGFITPRWMHPLAPVIRRLARLRRRHVVGDVEALRQLLDEGADSR